MAKRKMSEAEGNPEVDEVKTFKTPGNTVRVSDLLALAVKYWYWIVLSLGICGFYAYFSIARTTPLYKKSMSVLMRDDVQGNGTGSSSINLSELGLNQSSTILEDEMEALRSPDLIEQVVVALNLRTLYSTPDGLHRKELYGKTLPVRVSFPDLLDLENASLHLSVASDGKLSVRNLRIGEDSYKLPDDTAMEFGDAIVTPKGRVVVQKTMFFKEGEAYDIDVTYLTLAAATSMFGGEISVEHSANKKSNVVDISCVDANPDRADDILNTLMICYNQDWLAGKAEIVAATNDFISQRLGAVEQELSGVDNSISSYKSSNNVPDVEQSAAMAMQQSSEANYQVMTIDNELQNVRYLLDDVRTKGNNEPLPLVGLKSTAISARIGEYNNLLAQRNTQLESTFENNPLIQEKDANLKSMRKIIIESLENEIVSLRQQKASLEQRERVSAARVKESPQQARVLLSAERNQKVLENLYVWLLQKREENELSQAFANVNTRILRKPTGSQAPITPKKAQTYIIAFAIGLVVPFAGIYLLEISNNKVRGRKDLEGMSVPIVGEIPSFKKSGKKKVSYFKGEGKKRERTALEEEIVVEDGNRNLINEAVRVLRSNLIRMTGDASSTVIMVTSFNPGSGKTFLSMNLGLSLALKHHKVLLIDGDLRRASLSKFAGSPRKGMADYLSGACRDIDDVIVKDRLVEGLDILPVGAIPPNPTELLETKRFVNLIDYLRTEYEYIFIDCPPGEMMADAQIINEVADRTIFVVRVGLFQRPMLGEVEKMYQNKKYNNMMLVLNDSVMGARYGYSYSYGYGYSKKAKYSGYYGKGK